MKLTRLKLMLLLPLPVAFGVGYYGSQLIKSVIMEEIKAHTHKEIPQIPDFELMKADFSEEVLKVLKRIRVQGQREIPTEALQPMQGQTAEQQSPPTYVLSFTYVGERKRYAIINGKLVSEGENVSQEERVVKITREGVMLSGKWGKRWLRISD